MSNKKTSDDETSWADTIERIGKNVSEATPSQQLVIGGLTGWTVGYIGMKVGKAAALTIGCGLVVLQVASYKGYVRFNWKQFGKNATEVKKKLQKQITGASDNAPTSEQFVNFINDHIYLAGGFSAGLFLGIGSA